MDPKMSVGVDTNTINLNAPLNSSPLPKLTTPLLAVDAVTSTADWANPLSAIPLSANPNNYPSFTPAPGLTPRFSPTINSLTSPGGVSADIANITDPNFQTSVSIADLFASPEYPLTSVSSTAPKASQSRQPDPRSATFRPRPLPPTNPNHSKPQTSQPQLSQLQQQQPIPSISQTNTNPLSQPQTSQPISLPPPTNQPSIRTAATNTVQPTFQQSTQLPTSQPANQSYHHFPKPPQPPQHLSSQPFQHQQPTPIQPTPQQSAPMQPTMSLPQPVASSLPLNTNNTPYTTVADVPVSGSLSNSQPLTNHYAYNTMPPAPSTLGAAPTINPSLTDPKLSPDSKLPSRLPGHRSVLGSGISSSAVREAQARARIKADAFAKQRKKQRVDPAEPVKKLEKSEDDSKLSPNDLKQKRYKRRLALNRESAAVSRVRRKEYVKLLEEKLVNAEDERIKLMNELMQMRKEHDRLRGFLCKLEEKPDDAPEN